MRTLWLLLLLMSSAACADDRWLWSRDVGYRENHDPSIIVLDDGTALNVVYGAISWELVEQWKPDRKLRLAFGGGTGVVLIDPQTNQQISVLAGLAVHPIDQMAEDCAAQGTNRVDARVCYQRGYVQWDRELHRTYRVLRATLSEPRQKIMLDAQRQWSSFRDAQEQAIDAVYDREGSIWPDVALQRRIALVRQQALHLTSMLVW